MEMRHMIAGLLAPCLPASIGAYVAALMARNDLADRLHPGLLPFPDKAIVHSPEDIASRSTCPALQPVLAGPDAENEFLSLQSGPLQARFRPEVARRSG